MRILEKMRRYRIRNENIREVCKVLPITEQITERTKQWNEHITQMENTRTINKARDNKPKGRKSVDRPRM